MLLVVCLSGRDKLIRGTVLIPLTVLTDMMMALMVLVKMVMVVEAMMMKMLTKMAVLMCTARGE